MNFMNFEKKEIIHQWLTAVRILFCGKIIYQEYSIITFHISKEGEGEGVLWLNNQHLIEYWQMYFILFYNLPPLAPGVAPWCLVRGGQMLPRRESPEKSLSWQAKKKVMPNHWGMGSNPVPPPPLPPCGTAPAWYCFPFFPELTATKRLKSLDNTGVLDLARRLVNWYVITSFQGTAQCITSFLSSTTKKTNAFTMIFPSS